MKLTRNGLVLATALSLASSGLLPGSLVAQENADYFYEWKDVSGTAIHYFSTSIQHAERPTPWGVEQFTTDTIELSGDLHGRILYQPVTRIYGETNTLVNRGNQVFSGTVLGIGPVMLHDDQFRFEVDLETGATTGKVWLVNRISGPLIRCHLDIVGAGMTPEGNAMVDYTGKCRMFRSPVVMNRW